MVDKLTVPPLDFLSLCFARFEKNEYSEHFTHTFKLADAFGIAPSYAYGQVDPLLRMRRLYSVILALTTSKEQNSRKRAENAVNLYAQYRQSPYNIDAIEDLPIGIASPLKEAVRTSQLSPSGSWSAAVYRLIGRNDLAEGVSNAPDISLEGYRSIKDYLVSCTQSELQAAVH